MEDSISKSTFEQFFTKQPKVVLRNMKRMSTESSRFRLKNLNEVTGRAEYSDSAKGSDIEVAMTPASNGCNLSISAEDEEQSKDYSAFLSKSISEDPTRNLIIAIVAVAVIILAVISFVVVGQVQQHNEQQQIEDQFSCVLQGGSVSDCDK